MGQREMEGGKRSEGRKEGGCLHSLLFLFAIFFFSALFPHVSSSPSSIFSLLLALLLTSPWFLLPGFGTQLLSCVGTREVTLLPVSWLSGTWCSELLPLPVLLVSLSASPGPFERLAGASPGI